MTDQQTASLRSVDASEDVEALEVRLLLEAVHARYGVDFRDYAPASLRRRLWRRVLEEGLTTISGLQERVLHDSSCMERLLLDLSINVTAMFRDPAFFRVLREQVLPQLHTWPFSRVWVAGCSTGEEAWSMAILLEEAGLSERTRLYATDMNHAVLEKARLGVFGLDHMRTYTRNYQESGGTRSFSDYYTSGYDGAKFSRNLIDNVVFAPHNLVTDRSFNEFHLILCRNVLIYFDTQLQHRVYQLFTDSLVRLGVLGLGPKESLGFSPVESRYDVVDAERRIWKLAR